MTHNIHTGDVLTVLKTLPDNYFDAVLSDPPYGISFMGKEWDKGVPSAEVYAELLRVLKPGAFGLHFGGTRMWHRLAVNLEDAGFELRDTVMWLYGSGFPKSHNISKAIDKNNGEAGRLVKFVEWMRTTGLKAKQINDAIGKADVGSHYPRVDQPAIPTRALWGKLRPLCGEVPAWVDELVARVEAEREIVGQGSSGIAGAFGSETWASVEGAVVASAFDITAPATEPAKLWDGYGTALKPAWEPALLVQKPIAGTFANNALTHGCGGLNIDGGRVAYLGEADQAAAAAAAAAMRSGADQNAGRTAYGSFNNGAASIAPYLEKQGLGRFPANLILDDESGAVLDASAKGGPSRFFYSAKVSTGERSGGVVGKNNHPTLKPLALTEYLARLLLVPPRADGQPRRILVPFSGAGSEMIGCLLAGWDEVHGIEIDPAFVDIAHARIAHHAPGSTRL